MYNRPTNTENATKLPIDQDAWLLFRFDKLEVIRLHLSPGASMENHVTGKKRFWSNRGTQSLELLVMKSKQES